MPPSNRFTKFVYDHLETQLLSDGVLRRLALLKLQIDPRRALLLSVLTIFGIDRPFVSAGGGGMRPIGGGGGGGDGILEP